MKLDIASDEITTSDPVRKPLVMRYDDQLETLSLPTYSLDESAAEKLRCVVQRLQCRDLFDIHRLLVEEGVDAATAWAQFETKAAHRDIDPGLFAAAVNALLTGDVDVIDNLLARDRVPELEEAGYVVSADPAPGIRALGFNVDRVELGVRQALA